MRLLVSALEPSSNFHLETLLQYLPNVSLTGIFEHRLSSTPPLFDTKETALMGFADVVRHIPKMLHMQKRLCDAAGDVDAVLLMDSSGFNLPLAKRIKKRFPHQRIIYYILPQVWASRPKRAKALERYCDELLAILPFESAYYKEQKVRYVGHPLLDTLKLPYRPVDNVVAFLPGSRPSEIKRLMPIFAKVRQILDKEIHPLLVIPPHFSRQDIAKLYTDNRKFKIIRNTQEALAQSRFAFICSGTATLEAALMGTPFVLSYIAKKLDFAIAKRILRINHVGLANILLDHLQKPPLHEELLQEAVTPKRLIEAYKQTDFNHFTMRAAELKRYLSHPSAQQVAQIILQGNRSC